MAGAGRGADNSALHGVLTADRATCMATPPMPAAMNCLLQRHWICASRSATIKVMKTSEFNNISAHSSETTSVPRFFRRWVSAYVAQYEPVARRADHADVSTLLPPTA